MRPASLRLITDLYIDLRLCFGSDHCADDTRIAYIQARFGCESLCGEGDRKGRCRRLNWRPVLAPFHPLTR